MQTVTGKRVAALLRDGVRRGRPLVRAGREATIWTGSGQDAHDAPAEAMVVGTINAARQRQTVDHQRHAALYAVGLVSLARALQSRRFLEHVIVGVIGLAALADIVRKNVDRDFARLIAWDNAKLRVYQVERRRLQGAKADPSKAS